MSVDVRLAAVGTVLLLASSALLTQTALDWRLPTVLAAIAAFGAVATVARLATPTA
ncbi:MULTISPECIES: hypothetical protein [Haloferax]|uniref:Uncharacterized protein n=1 Tax=Haloferax gibbonsii TaxID=35746 RepID=A0A871BE65_HALGI|nr:MULTISPECIES: hypothetical protein [Haloferax]QOS11272.1 uncharacterized protein HfgLR_05645 [Haloferax gibbonsii]